MAVLLSGGKMMFLGKIADSFTNKETGEIIELPKLNLMDTETNEIHTISVSAKNEILMEQIKGLKMASMVQVVFAIEFDKYAVAKKQNPTRFKLIEMYPA